MNTGTSRVLQRRFMRPQYQDLGSLGYGFHWNKVPVRVLREWDNCSYNNYYEKAANYILLDAQNNRYWAVMECSERPCFQQSFCVGLLYNISNFRIVPTTIPSRPVPTDRLIIFSKKTIIHELLHTCGIERLKFNLCCWETIVSRDRDPATLIEICGVLTSVGNINYGTNDIERLDLNLITNSLVEVQISLWGIQAFLFAIDFASCHQKNVVLIITGLLAKIHHGNILLSSTQATSLHFNPTYAEVSKYGRHIASAYGEFICPIPSETQLGRLLIPNDHPPTATLKEILKNTVWVHQRYSCEVTIVNIVLHEQHKAISCKSCKAHATLDREGYYCNVCGRNFVTTVSSLGLPLLVKDENSTALFLIQGPQLKQLSGLHVQDYLEYQQMAPHTFRTHSCIRYLMGSICTLDIELTPSAYSNTTGDLLVKRVLKYTKLIPQPSHGNRCVPSEKYTGHKRDVTVRIHDDKGETSAAKRLHY